MVNKLVNENHHVTVLSRSADALAGLENVTHVACDVTKDDIDKSTYEPTSRPEAEEEREEVTAPAFEPPSSPPE